MNEKLQSDYKKSLDFWESNYANYQDEQKSFDSNNWKEVAPSEKFITALSSFSKCKNVLDYGCGNGWGSVIMAKTGCKSIVSVELSNSAIKKVIENSQKYGVNNSIKAQLVSPDWINSESSEKYDGFFCSNVIDVVPEEISNNILAQAHRILKQNSKVIIGLNFYLNTESALKNKIEAINNYIYRDGILRMVSRTDQEWSDIFSKYFTIEKIEHFSWPGESQETRRLFYLKNH